MEKQKKKGIIKRSGRGNIQRGRRRWWRKVEGERKRLEEEVAEEKRVEREGIGGGGLTVRSETLGISVTIGRASGLYCVIAA